MKESALASSKDTYYRNLKIFGENFKMARLSSKLTQQDIQLITGIEQAFLSRLERGKTNVSIETAVVLSWSVKVPLWQLFVPT